MLAHRAQCARFFNRVLDTAIVECIDTLYTRFENGARMLITINPQDARPIYQQVVDSIKALIARGELTEGVSLPPVRQVAADLGVNLNTIAAAYRELQSEGLVTIRHGSGAVVASRTIAGKNDDVLRTPLRTALTQLILAGLPRATIMNMVSEELRNLVQGELR